jgi:hypothetical protein
MAAVPADEGCNLVSRAGPAATRGAVAAGTGPRPPSSHRAALLVLGLSALGPGLGLLALVPIQQTLDAPEAGGRSTLGRAVAAVGVPPTLARMLVGYAVLDVGAAALAAWSEFLLTRRQVEFVDILRARMLAAVGQAWWRTVVTCAGRTWSTH